MRASAVSRPTRSARITSPPEPLTVPPVSFAPTAFMTGIDSPVISDSSTALAPSATSPSTGIFSPGRTRIRSPTAISSSATSCSCPSASIRSARFGARSRSARIASPVFSRAVSSSTCPTITSTVMTAAASK